MSKPALTEKEAAQLRAAAVDLSRAAEDYEHEGLMAIAKRMRGHAVNLWRLSTPILSDRACVSWCGTNTEADERIRYCDVCKSSRAETRQPLTDNEKNAIKLLR